MARNATDPAATLARTFEEAEQRGLRLAIKGRVVALVLVAIWFAYSRSGDPFRVLAFVGVIAGFAAVGGLHYALIGSPYDRPWIKYAMVTLDLAVLSLLMATQPIYPSVDVPQAMVFRNDFFPYYFIVLGVAAFSFSPGLVAWAGLAGATGWMAAFAWAIKDMADPLDWSDMGSNPTTEHFLRVFLSPDFIASGSRVQEAVAYLVVAALIAIVVWRARATVRRQLELDQERRLTQEVFGQYVPETVARALIADRGVLAPVERGATVLFADIAGFTRLTERTDPQRIVRVLNAYFDGAARIIADHKGIITQFQGDAILATFNVPLEDPDHGQNAVRAALALRAFVAERAFDGQRLAIRIGVSTGPLIAGDVGGGGRRSYTVHGTTVNLAARLEALNKEHGTDILLAGTTAEILGGLPVTRVGETTIRGLATPVAIFTPGAVEGPPV